MVSPHSPKILWVSLVLMLVLAAAMVLGLSIGSSTIGLKTVWASLFTSAGDATHQAIIWKIRLPRVLLAALVGATLSLGGLVFQAILKNPLAEPYILGISGGAAIGAIIGIIMGLSRIPGVGIMAFLGSLATLLLILSISSGSALLIRDTLLLSGVMVNAFCTAVIMFLLSMTQDSRLHTIIFWLMGDLSASPLSQVGLTAAILFPCFVIIFVYSHQMNLLLLGSDMAASMGVSVRRVTLTLLVITSFMVSTTVSQCGLIGFVGLVVPHLFRLGVGPDHRILVPCCIFGGGAYMVVCDLLARWLPAHGEMPDGVITAMIGAPLFILLLRRLQR
ncbi:iron ABC transporter permease [Desulfosarcina sp. OttesenSCG-928-A07]|nr:iron ABC transporter permease [Desulfosarcina sp. OttesenSCG-928-G17]MDL2329345.1 iron ABC transporter permease [Desulfosarcina sp. OttesenSCG-928-A07]